MNETQKRIGGIMTKSELADKYNTSTKNLHDLLKRNGIDFGRVHRLTPKQIGIVVAALGHWDTDYTSPETV